MSLPVAEPITLELARSWLPRMRQDRNKYTAGQVLLIGGFAGMEGAAWLAAEAVLRSGAGVVKWARDSLTAGSPVVPEVVQIDASHNIDVILQELARTKSLLVGVGSLGQLPGTWMVEVIQAAQEQGIPIVWDGGALHWIREGWVAPSFHDCLTPHGGELTALAPIAEHDRQKGAYALAERWNSTIVAKGPVTWVVTPGLPTLVSHEGDPGMATAGAGDVLAGLLAGLLAQGVNSHEAAGLAVWLHSRAGKEAASSETSFCVTASSILQYLPEAFYALLHV